MTHKQLEHLSRIRGEAGRRLSEKYVRGAEEHNSYLPDMSVMELLDNAIDEAVDQLTYLLTIKEKLSEPVAG